VRTLQFGLHVADREASVAFYTTLGYEIVGEVPDSPIGHLTMLKLPDDEFVTLELVDDPESDAAAPGFSHFAVQVQSLKATVTRLATSGIHVDSVGEPAQDLHTANIMDPDGRKIELVEWPPTHAAGLSASDWDDNEKEDRMDSETT
jgi:lactoylglutathione lyase